MKGKLLKVLGVTLLAAALFVAGTKEVKADEFYIGYFEESGVTADYVVKYGPDIWEVTNGELSQGDDVTDKTMIVQNYSNDNISVGSYPISAQKETLFRFDGISEICGRNIYRGTEGTNIKVELVYEHSYTWVTEVCSDTGRTYKVKKCKNCNKYDWSTQTFIEEKKEEIEEKEEKKEESSSSSSSKASVPVLSAAEQAKVTEQAQAVVGSKAYTEKQAEVQKSVTTAVAALTKLTPAQVSAVQSIGVAVNLGGCTTLDRATVVTLASNSTIPYNMAFTWNGLAFSVKVPAGADYLSLLDANGNLQMWKLVQKYGIATVKVVK